MGIIIRLQNLPWSANAEDIRKFFNSLTIPDGGVHIIGGEHGDAFIAFGSDEDARQAMLKDGESIKDVNVKLLLSSRVEMQTVIETAKQQVLSSQQQFFQTFAAASQFNAPTLQMNMLPNMLSILGMQNMPVLPAATGVPPATPTSTIQNVAQNVADSKSVDMDSVPPAPFISTRKSSSSSVKRDDRRDSKRSQSRSRSRSRDRRSYRDRHRRDRSRDRKYRKDRSRNRSSSSWSRSRSRSRDRYRRRSRSKDRRSRDLGRDRDKEYRIVSKDGKKSEDNVEVIDIDSPVEKQSETSRKRNEKMNAQNSSKPPVINPAKIPQRDNKRNVTNGVSAPTNKNQKIEKNNDSGSGSVINNQDLPTLINNVVKLPVINSPWLPSATAPPQISTDNDKQTLTTGNPSMPFIPPMGMFPFSAPFPIPFGGPGPFQLPPNLRLPLPMPTDPNTLIRPPIQNTPTNVTESPASPDSKADSKSNSFNKTENNNRRNSGVRKQFWNRQSSSNHTTNNNRNAQDYDLPENDQIMESGFQKGNFNEGYYTNKFEGKFQRNENREKYGSQPESHQFKNTYQKNFNRSENFQQYNDDQQFSEYSNTCSGFNPSSTSNCIELQSVPHYFTDADIKRIFSSIPLFDSSIKFMDDKFGTRNIYVKFLNPKQKELAWKKSGMVFNGYKVIINDLPQTTWKKMNSVPSAPHTSTPFLKFSFVPLHARKEDIVSSISVTVDEIFLEKAKKADSLIAFVRINNLENVEKVLANKQRLTICGCRVKVDTIDEKEFNDSNKWPTESCTDVPVHNKTEFPIKRLRLEGTKKLRAPDSYVKENNGKEKNPITKLVKCKNIILQNLPQGISNDEIDDFFTDVGIKPMRILIVYDDDYKQTGDAYCEFISEFEAEKSLQKNHRKLRNRSVTVRLVPKNEVSKATHESSTEVQLCPSNGSEPSCKN